MPGTVSGWSGALGAAGERAGGGLTTGTRRRGRDRRAADGWDLIVVARGGERLGELGTGLTKAHAVTVRAIQADLARRDEVQRVCDDISAEPVDMLVNNAGLAHYMPFADLPPRRHRLPGRPGRGG